MSYNAAVAKPAYYKQNVTNFTQLFNNIIRLQYDSRISGSTRAQYIENMFNSYLQHSQTQQQHNCTSVQRIKHKHWQ
jgi:UDP-glucose 4-epimerase